MKIAILMGASALALAACATPEQCITSYTTDKYGTMVINDCASSTSFHTYNVRTDDEGDAPNGPVDRPDTPTTPDDDGPSDDPDTGGPEDDTPDTGGEPSDGGGKSKGNASANNGKGGNYDKTGHSDNGKGNGKGRR